MYLAEGIGMAMSWLFGKLLKVRWKRNGNDAVDILYSIMTLASALLCSSDLRPKFDCITVTLS